MILILTGLFTTIVFGYLMSTGHNVLAWHLGGALALLGGAAAAHFERTSE